MAETSIHQTSKFEKRSGQKVIVEPSGSLISLKFGELWQYRELLYFLVWRDLKIRYKQTVLGTTWIIFQPLISTLVFTLLFGFLLKVPSDNVPYPVFSLTALIPWTYFASSLTKSSTSLVSNSNLITKVYFPRLNIPISAVLSGLVDLAISLVILVIVLILYGVPISMMIFSLPIFIFFAVITALGFSLWLSALNVQYRDVNYLIPFLVQIWMYATPVIYSPTLIPLPYRYLLALNPMTGVVEGFRWAVYGQSIESMQTQGPLFIVSIAIALLVLVSGIMFFRKMEKTFADII